MAVLSAAAVWPLCSGDQLAARPATRVAELSGRTVVAAATTLLVWTAHSNSPASFVRAYVTA